MKCHETEARSCLQRRLRNMHVDQWVSRFLQYLSLFCVSSVMSSAKEPILKGPIAGVEVAMVAVLSFAVVVALAQLISKPVHRRNLRQSAAIREETPNSTWLQVSSAPILFEQETRLQIDRLCRTCPSLNTLHGTGCHLRFHVLKAPIRMTKVGWSALLRDPTGSMHIYVVVNVVVSLASEADHMDNTTGDCAPAYSIVMSMSLWVGSRVPAMSFNIDWQPHDSCNVMPKGSRPRLACSWLRSSVYARVEAWPLSPLYRSTLCRSTIE